MKTATAPSPLLRFAAPADARQMAQLRIDMQQEVNRHHGDDTPIQQGALGSIEAFFAKVLGSENFLAAIAVSDGEMVSVNGLTFYYKPPGLDGGTGLVGYVTNVYTAPQWRGQGLATRLMQMLIDEARNKGAERLHLGATPDGKTVYERLGFTAPRNAPMELRLKD